MKNQQKYISAWAQYSFLILWVYAATVKLMYAAQSEREMELQLFPVELAHILWWLIPAVELTLALLLLYRPTVGLGIQLSTLLICTFTVYLLLGISKVLGSTPCACGGIWPGNKHWIHIALNSLFIILGTIYWILAHSSRTGKDVFPESGRKEGADD